MPRLTCLEMFAGAGGAALGLRQAGYASALSVEFDPDAAATLAAAGFPARCYDVRDIPWHHYRHAAHLLWASPPCQAWSSAGKRLGAKDERNGWPWVFDALDAALPTWFLGENVRGMTFHKKKADCNKGADPKPDDCPACYLHEVVLPELRSRYAHVSWRVLDAADYGVPQHRRRLFVVAGPKPYRWPVPTHGKPPALGLKPWRTIRDAIGPHLVRHQSPSAGTVQRSPDRPAPTVGTKGTLFAESEQHDGPRVGAWRVIGGGTNPHGKGRAHERTFRDVTDEPSPTMTAAQVGNRGPWVTGGSQPERLDRPAPTVTTTEVKGTRGDGMRMGPDRASDALYLATGRRRLTPQECAALQGFPAAHPWQGNKTSVYRQVGNAVPPRMAYVLASHIPN